MNKVYYIVVVVVVAAAAAVEVLVVAVELHFRIFKSSPTQIGSLVR